MVHSVHSVHLLGRAPLLQPPAHLPDLRVLRRLDLGGKVGYLRGVGLLQGHVGHLHRLPVMRDHELREGDVRVRAGSNHGATTGSMTGWHFR